MVRRGGSIFRHRRRGAWRRVVMRAGRGGGNRNAFAAQRHDDSWIVRLIADRTRLSIVDPEIGPVIINPGGERAAVHGRVLPEILRDIERPGFSIQRNDDAALVSVLRLRKLNFRAAVPAFERFRDLFFWRFSEREDRFFDFYFAGGRRGGI